MKINIYTTANPYQLSNRLLLPSYHKSRGKSLPKTLRNPAEVEKSGEIPRSWWQMVIIKKMAMNVCPWALIHNANANPNLGKTDRLVGSQNSYWRIKVQSRHSWVSLDHPPPKQYGKLLWSPFPYPIMFRGRGGRLPQTGGGGGFSGRNASRLPMVNRT